MKSSLAKCVKKSSVTQNYHFASVLFFLKKNLYFSYKTAIKNGEGSSYTGVK